MDMFDEAKLKDKFARQRSIDMEYLKAGGTPPSSPGTSVGGQPASPQKSLPELQAESAAMKKRAELGEKATADKNALDIKNKKAFSAFEIGMDNVEKTFAELDTGPISGSLPALTAKAQKAEGAVSMMAPILKSLFRESGEGIFTDKDQELLLNMAPKRTDHQEVVKYKTDMIRQIVAAKLGTSTEPDKTGGELTPQTKSNEGWSIRKVE